MDGELPIQAYAWLAGSDAKRESRSCELVMKGENGGFQVQKGPLRLIISLAASWHCSRPLL